MKKTVIIFTVLVSSIVFSQKRNILGFKKNLAMIESSYLGNNQGLVLSHKKIFKSYFNSFDSSEYSIFYKRVLGKKERWIVGMDYYSFKNSADNKLSAYFITSEPILNALGSNRDRIVHSRYFIENLRIIVSYNLLKRDYLLLRINSNFPIYKRVEQKAFYNLEEDVNFSDIEKVNNFDSNWDLYIPEFSLDVLYPLFSHFEAGLSFNVNYSIDDNSPLLGIKTSFAVRF